MRRYHPAFAVTTIRCGHFSPSRNNATLSGCPAVGRSHKEQLEGAKSQGMKRITAPSVFIIALMRRHGGMVRGIAARRARQGRAFSRTAGTDRAGLQPGNRQRQAARARSSWSPATASSPIPKPSASATRTPTRLSAEDSIFRIYSMTKPMVSVAAMILMEEGRLQLHRSGFEVTAGIRQAPGQRAELDPYGKVTYSTVPAERPITVHDLLRHTAGLGYGEDHPERRRPRRLCQGRPLQAR